MKTETGIKKRLNIFGFFALYGCIAILGIYIWFLIWIFTGWDYLGWMQEKANKKGFYDINNKTIEDRSHEITINDGLDD